MVPFYLRDPFTLLWVGDLRMQNHISEQSWKLRGEGWCVDTLPEELQPQLPLEALI